mmetsp:Transcript_43266/g.108365  ORF Transcript_43266/g.108365 Transcript_43266/m.108365 type:complete len:116 (+) Transcript_43266:127-474(+)
MARPPITSHVLDTALGRPAQGVPITLSVLSGSEWSVLGRAKTNSDGRAPELLPVDYKLAKGVYKCMFQTGAYYEATGQKGFYPEVPVIFEVVETTEHYHIPLLLSPFGYSTYRGS